MPYSVVWRGGRFEKHSFKMGYDFALSSVGVMAGKTM